MSAAPEPHPDVAPIAALLGTWEGEGRGRYPTIEALREREDIARFVRWIADKPADFHAPTRRGR